MVEVVINELFEIILSIDIVPLPLLVIVIVSCDNAPSEVLGNTIESLSTAITGRTPSPIKNKSPSPKKLEDQESVSLKMPTLVGVNETSTSAESSANTSTNAGVTEIFEVVVNVTC